MGKKLYLVGSSILMHPGFEQDMSDAGWEIIRKGWLLESTDCENLLRNRSEYSVLIVHPLIEPTNGIEFAEGALQYFNRILLVIERGTGESEIKAQESRRVGKIYNGIDYEYFLRFALD
jgi:hypothetical protein